MLSVKNTCAVVMYKNLYNKNITINNTNFVQVSTIICTIIKNITSNTIKNS